MPLRPEDQELLEQQQPTSVTVRLVDVEPISGLVAACTRLSTSLTAEVAAQLPDDVIDAITQIQSILWRLEHSQPERPAP